MLVGTDRHAVLRQVRKHHQHCREFGLDRIEPLGRCLQPIADAADLGHHRCAVLTFGFELADLLRQAVAPRLQLFGARLQRFALGFERTETLDVEKGLR
jgi:hypothetical protein